MGPSYNNYLDCEGPFSVTQPKCAYMATIHVVQLLYDVLLNTDLSTLNVVGMPLRQLHQTLAV